jgi:hypothetical protein
MVERRVVMKPTNDELMEYLRLEEKIQKYRTEMKPLLDRMAEIETEAKMYGKPFNTSDCIVLISTQTQVRMKSKEDLIKEKTLAFLEKHKLLKEQTYLKCEIAKKERSLKVVSA